MSVLIVFENNKINCTSQDLKLFGTLVDLMEEFPADPFIYECADQFEFAIIRSHINNCKFNITSTNARDMILSAEKLDCVYIIDLYDELEDECATFTSLTEKLIEIYGGYDRLSVIAKNYILNTVHNEIDDEKVLEDAIKIFNLHKDPKFVSGVYTTIKYQYMHHKKSTLLSRYLKCIWGQKLGDLSEFYPVDRNFRIGNKDNNKYIHKCIQIRVVRFLLQHHPTATEMMLKVLE